MRARWESTAMRLVVPKSETQMVPSSRGAANECQAEKKNFHALCAQHSTHTSAISSSRNNVHWPVDAVENLVPAEVTTR